MRTALIAAGLVLAIHDPAGAWGRSGSHTGRLGNTTSWSAQRTASGASGTVTGPGGRTVSGTLTPTQYGERATITGPQGGTTTAQGGRYTLPNGQTVYGGVVSGPQGGTAGGVYYGPH